MNFRESFECLGENTVKPKTFSILIEKEITKVDKDKNDASVVYISYKIKCIDSVKFMAISQKKIIKLNVENAIVFVHMEVVRIIW